MATPPDQFMPDRQKTTAANSAEYGGPLADLQWISEAGALEAEGQRAGILAALTGRIESDFKDTKPRLGPLSPGCRICGQGRWSCLFINGKCNCRCFYCPTTQNEIGVPTTNQVPFNKAEDYADYVRLFDFSGVSISGGEPLLTFDRTLRYIRSVRRKMGDRLHIWLYTNTTLLTQEYVLKLQDAGLNEIRMDISAADYGLKKAALAVGAIPCVTVEIPAVPEDQDRLAALLPVIQDMGINHLNLHQLRLTPHNRVNFKNRPYTYLHGDKVTVLESELTALALIREACSQGLSLPINYCSFVYKHRYQRAAARRRNARLVSKDHESITENGYIRTLALQGPREIIAANIQRLDDPGVEHRHWLLGPDKDRLFFHPRLWPLIDMQGCELLVSYAEAGLCPHISYHHYFKEIRINPDKRLYVEKRPVIRQTRLDTDQQNWFGAHCLNDQPRILSQSIPAALQVIAGCEFIEPGLQVYG
jgi:pyruvate formate-lyase activating enzyme-like uncharacterized protein